MIIKKLVLRTSGDELATYIDWVDNKSVRGYYKSHIGLLLIEIKLY